MIIKMFLTIALSVALVSCNGQNTDTIRYAEAEPIHIHRFDKDLFRLVETPDTLLGQQIKQQYPRMLDIFGKGILNMQTPDDPSFFEKLTAFYAEPTLKGLYRDAILQYDVVTDIEKQLGTGFAYLRTHFPNMQIPAVYMHVSGFNQNVLVGDSLLSISIDKYLGNTYPLYQDFFYDYQKQKMQRPHIAQDYLTGWLMSEYPFAGKENVLLDRLIYEGKIKYLVSQALPSMEPAVLMGYTNTALNWCEENEAVIWKAIVERKHLYTPDPLTTAQYFEDIPSRFLADEAPGNLGTWVGWQIIDRYMKENTVSLQALMHNNNSQEILTASKYKP